MKRKEIEERFDEIIAELQELAKLPDKEYFAEDNRKKVSSLLEEGFALYKSAKEL